MAKKSRDAKLQLGEPWAGRLSDYCEALLGAPQKNVIRAALDAFIDAELEANPSIRARYDAAQRKRRAEIAPNVTVLPGGKDKP
jgi:hypothetical protein